MTDNLLELARIYCATEGIGLRGLEKRSGREGFFKRLAAGGRFKAATAEKALAWFAANWPTDLAWPDGVVRPEAMQTVEGEPAMPDVLFEEDDEQKTARLADEADLALFKARLEQAELQRRAEIERVREAMNTVQDANPATLFDLECQKAVQGTNLRDQRCAAPSLGGQTPQNMERLEREAASAERARQAELASRKRWLNEQSDVIEKLCAGQEPSQQAAIRAAFKAAGGS